jgi:septum site-determining protein MinD
LQLDVLMIDTHPGLNEETLLSLIISHQLIIVLRPDHQDYEGTGIAIKVARGLNVPNMMLVVNKAPADLDHGALAGRLGEIYRCQVAGVLPHFDEMMRLGSEGVFVLRHPDHPLSRLFRGIATRVEESGT